MVYMIGAEERWSEGPDSRYILKRKLEEQLLNFF